MCVLIYVDTMQVSDFMKESDAMKQLRHPYLVRLIGVCCEPQNTFIALQFYRMGSVQDHCHRCQLCLCVVPVCYRYLLCHAIFN